MTQREYEDDQAARVPTRDAEPLEADRPGAPVSRAVISAVGNRAFAKSVSARRELSRQVVVPPAPVTLNAPAEREKDKEEFPEGDKERARRTVIGPLRAAAAKLGAGEKADVASVLRHLKPIRAAVAGVKWPKSVHDEAISSLEELDPVITVLDSLKLDKKQAVARARARWAVARVELRAAQNAIRKAQPNAKKNPDAEERPDSTADINALAALAAQVDATIQDLAKAPKTPEGIKDVEETAAGLIGQCETIQPPEAANEMAKAKAELTEGVAILIPLALGKEDTIKEAEKELGKIASRLAVLVGDEAPSTEDSGSDDDEPAADLPPAPPPPSGALPPPPPPPPGAGAGSKAGP